MAVSRFAFSCSVCAIALMAMMPLYAHADNDRGGNRGRGNQSDSRNTQRVASGNFERIQQSHAQKNYVVNNSVRDIRGHHHDLPRYQNNHRAHRSYGNNSWRPNVVYVPQPVYYQRYHPQYHTNHPYIGRRLGYYTPVPHGIVTYLNPAPRGYYYSMVDQNVFMVSSYDDTIIQVISFFMR